jgi:hypothetical protein
MSHVASYVSSPTDSSVSKCLLTGLAIGVRSPVDPGLFSLPSRPDCLWGPPSGPLGSVSVGWSIRRADREAYHSP